MCYGYDRDSICGRFLFYIRTVISAKFLKHDLPHDNGILNHLDYLNPFYSKYCKNYNFIFTGDLMSLRVISKHSKLIQH